jgi:hypothetical protein
MKSSRVSRTTGDGVAAIYQNVLATLIAGAIGYAAYTLGSLDKRVSRIEDRLGIATAEVKR